MTQHVKQRNPMVIMILFIAILFIGFTFSIHYIFQNNQIGIDFMFTWHAGRVLFLEKGDPYGPELALQNQLWVYGHPSLPGQDHQNFAYPLFILVPLFPFILLSYDWAQAAWMSLNITLLLTLGLIFFPQVPKWITLLLLLFYEVYFTVIIGNTALLISIFILIILDRLLIKEEKVPGWVNSLIGIGLSLLLGKPQLVWLFLILILVTSLLKKNWALIAGFFAGFAGMTAGFLAIYPTWPLNWLKNAMGYSKEGGIMPAMMWFLSRLFPPDLTWILYLVSLGLALLVTVFIFHRWRKNQLPTLLLIAWCAWVTSFFDPSSLSPDRNIMLIPLILWASQSYKKMAVKITWGSIILVTNLAFALTQANIVPWAVDIWSQIGYSVWLLYIFTNQSERNNLPNVILQTR